MALSNEVSIAPENTKEEPVHLAYLGPLFSWHVKNDQNQAYPWNTKYSIHVTAEAIHFLVGNSESFTKHPCIVIEVSHTQGWILPQEKVHLQIQEPLPLLITAAWKAFEHYLASQGFKADLVQLNGYYQYEPKIKMKVLQMVSPSSEEHTFVHWKILQHVLEGKGVRQILGIPELASLWHLSIDKTTDALTTLRSLGYEVRSEYTNNQIPKGHVLIPYAFPTFSPNSVQQRKVLFPQAFLEQISLLPTNTVPQQGLWTIESWDAKYDNPYLSDTLDAFVEKLRGKDTSELTFGYVLLPEKKEYQDVDRKIQAIAEEYGVEIQVVSFDNWVQKQVKRAGMENISDETLAIAWLRAYAESLALHREERAPIDEPTYNWLQSLKDILI